MKRILFTGVLVAVASFSSSCAAPAEKPSTAPAPAATAAPETAANVEKEIRRLQAEYDKAALQQDAVAYERLFADDYTLTQAGGRVSTKAELIAQAKAGDVKMEVGRSDDIKVRVYGNTALVTCR